MRLVRSGLLLLSLLLLATRPVLAQRGHAYWDVNPDSLRQVLARQRADTARLRTLMQLADVGIEVGAGITATEATELRRLGAQLGRPELRAYRLLVTAYRLSAANDRGAFLDTATAAVAAFDHLHRPVPLLLVDMRHYFAPASQRAKRVYYLAHLATYRQWGDTTGMAACYHALAGSFKAAGDPNRAIGYYLQAAELYRSFHAPLYYDCLAVAGQNYAEWGNLDKALVYLRQSLAGAGSRARNHPYIRYTLLAQVQLQRHDYSAALRSLDQGIACVPGDKAFLTYALVLKSAVLLAQQRAGAAGALLRTAQQLDDSLHLPFQSATGTFELAATWAQYYEAVGDDVHAEAAWQAAHRQARQGRDVRLRLVYLRALTRFYQRHRRPAVAAAYAEAALGLTDTLAATQGALQVTHFEIAQAQQAQARRIARLRRAQTQAAARSARERTALGWLLGGTGLLVLVSGAQWRSHRRQQRANALLAAQKAQLAEQAARLGQLDEAKNQFFANVSHELRTPLTLVLGPLDGLLTDPASTLPAAVREPVALAHRSARRLHELVNRILDLTKLQAGRLELRPVPTAVAPLLRRVVTQFESLAAERRVALVAPQALPEGLRLLLDGDKVEQVLTNLLINALNHMPAGGAVTVGAALPDAAGHYVLTVRDTGPGIAPAEQGRVFERFYQSPQRQAQGGTGLGLALSRELATLLGGTLTLVSEPGLGAAFTLRFPATALGVEREELRVEEADEVGLGEEEAETEPAADDALMFPIHHSKLLIHNSTKPRVLVVEDQADLREYLRQLLAPAYEVLTATDGQDALDVLAREAPVDLVTTDAMMPRLSGTELLARLKADPARAGLPVLMLTARADEAHRLATLTVGVDDYLTKPFVPAELLARVATLLRRHAVRRQFASQPPEAPAPTPAEPRALAPEPVETEPADLAAAGPDAAASPLTSAAGAGQLARWQAQLGTRLADPAFGPTALASLLCLSERTLYRRLGELAGLTPAGWLRELRLAQARQLLEAGGFGSVADVADAAGFPSPKYFATLYAERFGRRPADYPAHG